MSMNHTKVVRVQKVPNTFGGPAWHGVFQEEGRIVQGVPVDGDVWQVVPVGEKLEPPKRCWYSQRYMPAQKVLRMLYESRWDGETHASAADCLTAAGY